MVIRASTSVGGPLDPKKYTGPTTKISADEFHKKLMAFGPKGPPLDWDPRGFEIDESSISPIKTMRGGGFPVEDAPMTSRPFEMKPEPYEPPLTERMDPYTGKMETMPGIREGDGREWSRGKLLPPTPGSSASTGLLDPSGRREPEKIRRGSLTEIDGKIGVVGLDGVHRTLEELERLRSTKDARDKERGARSPDESSGLLTPYTGTDATRFGS